MKVTTFEFMFYNYYLKYGIVMNYKFHTSNSGVVQSKTSQRIFIVEMYELETFAAQVKLTMMIIWTICMFISFLFFVYKCFGIIQTAYHHRRNDFQFIDVLLAFQLFFGVLCFSYYYYLFLAPQHHMKFSIPFTSEE